MLRHMPFNLQRESLRPMSDQIHIVSFLINSPINHTVLSWADPADNRLEALGSLKLWQELAQTMERGLFDGMFFADTPGVFDRYRDSHEDAARYGVCWPSHDPVVLLSAIAAGTTHLGLAATMSTSAYKPWTIVRQLGTIDYLSGGRVGWNIVTGHLRGEHRALGIEQVEHDKRYDMADEYMEVCYRLWNSIRPGAILGDKKSGIYADTSRIERVQYQGEYFSCDTIGPVLPSPQGHPVLFQAGSSGRGQQFAVRHADVVFSIQPNLPGMKRFMGEIQAVAKASGVKTPGVSFGIQTVLGGTEEEARARLAGIVERMPMDACLARLSGTLGVDFSGMDLDQPLKEIQTQASQGLMKAFAHIEGDKPLTLREVAIRWGVAVGKPQIVGTPEQVADQMEHIWRETGCYGYNMTPHIMPSSVEDFVDEVVPILQKKGVYRTEYTGTTFRENLGLD